MFRKMLAVLLILCLVPLCAMADDAFVCAGTVGHVRYTLTGTAVVIHEADYDGVWTGSVQLIGGCGTDRAECMLRTADISPLVEYFMQNQADATLGDSRLSAALNYACYHVMYVYGGQITGYQIDPDATEDAFSVSFGYAYPNDPSTYSGRLFVEGNVVTALLTGECGHNRQALDSMAFVTDEELAALYADRTVSFGKLSAVYPCEPTRTGEGWLAWLPGNTLVTVQYFPGRFDLSGFTPESVEPTMTRYLLPTVSGNKVYDPTWETWEDGTIVQNCATYCSEYIGEEFAEQAGQRYLLRIYMRSDAVWYITAADTEEGRAFLASITLE